MCASAVPFLRVTRTCTGSPGRTAEPGGGVRADGDGEGHLIGGQGRPGADLGPHQHLLGVHRVGQLAPHHLRPAPRPESPPGTGRPPSGRGRRPGRSGRAGPRPAGRALPPAPPACPKRLLQKRSAPKRADDGQEEAHQARPSRRRGWRKARAGVRVVAATRRPFSPPPRGRAYAGPTTGREAGAAALHDAPAWPPTAARDDRPADARPPVRDIPVARRAPLYGRVAGRGNLRQGGAFGPGTSSQPGRAGRAGDGPGASPGGRVRGGSPPAPYAACFTPARLLNPGANRRQRPAVSTAGRRRVSGPAYAERVCWEAGARNRRRG